MKLLICVTCQQIFNLSRDYQECRGHHGGGLYLDSINAKVWGPLDKIFILGFANGTLISALQDQIRFGDSEEKMKYGAGFETRGRDFTAFVIPESASSIIRVDEKFSLE